MLSPRSGEGVRVLFPHTHKASFIRKDLAILRSSHNVREVDCSSLFGPFWSLKDVFWADCVFCWFASLRFLPLVLFARLLRKKVLVVAGGYDVANLPSLRYGTMYGLCRRFLGRMLFRLADIVTCVSYSSASEARTNAKIPPEKIRVIHHGFEPDDHGMDSSVQKKDFVLTVGHADTCTIYRKGLLTVAEVSRCLPDVPFIFVGSFEEAALSKLTRAAGPNAEFRGFVNSSELHQLFSTAKVYIQPSLHEAFGCSVAEAMLYNCIPITSDRFSLPEVVGNAGFCVDPENVLKIAATVRQVLDETIAPDESPRDRILRKFPLEKRRFRLLEMLKRLADGGLKRPSEIASCSCEQENRAA